MDRQRQILLARREALKRELEKNQERLRLAVAALTDTKGSLDAYGLTPLIETEEVESEFPAKIVALSSDAKRILVAKGAKLYLYTSRSREVTEVGLVDVDKLIKFAGDDRFMCFRQGRPVIYDCIRRVEKIVHVSGETIDFLTWQDHDFIINVKNQRMHLFDVTTLQELEIGNSDVSFAFNRKSGHMFNINDRSGILRHLDNWSACQTIELPENVDPIHIESLNKSSLFVLFKCRDAINLKFIDFSAQEIRQIKRMQFDSMIVKYLITNVYLILLMKNGEVLFLDLRTVELIHRMSSSIPLDDVVVVATLNIISIGNKVYKIC